MCTTSETIIPTKTTPHRSTCHQCQSHHPPPSSSSTSHFPPHSNLTSTEYFRELQKVLSAIMRSLDSFLRLTNEMHLEFCRRGNHGSSSASSSSRPPSSTSLSLLVKPPASQQICSALKNQTLRSLRIGVSMSTDFSVEENTAILRVIKSGGVNQSVTSAELGWRLSADFALSFLDQILQKFPNLQSLSIEIYSSMSSKTLKRIEQHEKLEELVLKGRCSVVQEMESSTENSNVTTARSGSVQKTRRSRQLVSTIKQKIVDLTSISFHPKKNKSKKSRSKPKGPRVHILQAFTRLPPNLKTLHLSTASPIRTTHQLQALSNLTYDRNLDHLIMMLPEDHALSTKDLNHFLKNARVSRLDLSESSGLTSDFLPCFSNTRHIQHLVLDSIPHLFDFSDHLKEPSRLLHNFWFYVATHLHTVSFRDCRLSKPQQQDLLQILTENPHCTLKALNLQGWNHRLDVSNLADLLGHNTSLTSLQVECHRRHNNKIPPNSSLLEHNYTLQELSLGSRSSSQYHLLSEQENYHLELNRAGRRALKQQRTTRMDTPRLLARADAVTGPNAVFWMLQNGALF